MTEELAQAWSRRMRPALFLALLVLLTAPATRAAGRADHGLLVVGGNDFEVAAAVAT
jgi:hypothetical protein